LLALTNRSRLSGLSLWNFPPSGQQMLQSSSQPRYDNLERGLISLSSSVADPDPGCVAFLTPESGIRDRKKSGLTSWIIFSRAWFQLFGIRCHFNPESWMRKFAYGIRDKHSATLVRTHHPPAQRNVCYIHFSGSSLSRLSWIRIRISATLVRMLWELALIFTQIMITNFSKRFLLPTLVCHRMLANYLQKGTYIKDIKNEERKEKL
jgi:hypothetical protein